MTEKIRNIIPYLGNLTSFTQTKYSFPTSIKHTPKINKTASICKINHCMVKKKLKQLVASMTKAIYPNVSRLQEQSYGPARPTTAQNKYGPHCSNVCYEST